MNAAIDRCGTRVEATASTLVTLDARVGLTTSVGLHVCQWHDPSIVATSSRVMYRSARLCMARSVAAIGRVAILGPKPPLGIMPVDRLDGPGLHVDLPGSGHRASFGVAGCRPLPLGPTEAPDVWCLSHADDGYGSAIAVPLTRTLASMRRREDETDPRAHVDPGPITATAVTPSARVQLSHDRSGTLEVSWLPGEDPADWSREPGTWPAVPVDRLHEVLEWAYKGPSTVVRGIPTHEGVTVSAPGGSFRVCHESVLVRWGSGACRRVSFGQLCAAARAVIGGDR